MERAIADMEISSGESEGEEQWEDWEEEEGEGGEALQCLFCPSMSEGMNPFLSHLSESHSFHLTHFIRSNKMDFYRIIKLVNYVRSRVRENPKVLEENPGFYTDPSAYHDDKYLLPVLPGDPLLFHVGDLEDEEGAAPMQDEPSISGDQGEPKEDLRQLVAEKERELREHKAKLEELQNSFRNYVALTEASFLNQAAAPESSGSESEGGSESEEEEKGKEKEKEKEEGKEKGKGKKEGKERRSKEKRRDYYFESYSHFSIHEEMIRDRVRTDAYRDFILKNPELFGGKVVLDVGCGTSILSLFAAQAGAKKVYGVDASEMAIEAKKIVSTNKMDHVVSILHSKVEEVELPSPADIIISEWMGYFLLFESMLDSVLAAARKLLAPGGKIYPERANMQVCLGEDKRKLESITFWDNVYGFDFSTMREHVAAKEREEHEEACVFHFPPGEVTSSPAVIRDLHITPEMEVTSLDFTSSFTLEASRDHVCNCLVGFFDVFFDGEPSSNHVAFSTSPLSPPTHWKQTVFYLDRAFPLRRGERLHVTMEVGKHPKNPRSLDISLTCYQRDDDMHFQRYKL